MKRLDEIRAREQAATDRPDPCVMTHTPPFDFAQCETHDETFPLGDSCKWHGVESISVFLQDQVDQQRDRAVRAEIQRDRLQAAVDAVLELHRPVPMVPGFDEASVCDGCENPGRFVRYPCPTIQALGEDDE